MKLPKFRRPRKEALTDQQVEAIRLSDLPDTHWAAEFGVNRSTIRRARCGGHYLHVSVPPQPWGRRPRADIGAKRSGEPCKFDVAAISLPGEEWRPVLGWERFYRVSNLGRIYSLHQNGRITIGMLVRGAYRIVKMRDGERHANLPVHCMVLEAFVSPRPVGMQGCHCNGRSTDNQLANLRWDTPKANQADRILHGTSLKGRKMPKKAA